MIYTHAMDDAVAGSPSGTRDAEHDSLDLVASQVRECPLCDLCRTRTHAVPGAGNGSAQVMFIGEGPGWNEDQQGLPFVGAAGKYLDELLGIAKLKRPDVFITNVVKCRPPGNRDPLPDEIAACNGYLERQISLDRSRCDCHPWPVLDGALVSRRQNIAHSRSGKAFREMHRDSDVSPGGGVALTGGEGIDGGGFCPSSRCCRQIGKDPKRCRRIANSRAGPRRSTATLLVQSPLEATNISNSEAVKLIFLGGLAEVGRNMFLFESEQDIIVIDCGIGFPQEEQLGIDLVLPDISYLREHRDKVRALFITHGHEDHIGAIPYLIPDLAPIPIYATKLTLGLIGAKLDERKLRSKVDLIELDPDSNTTYKAGDFTIEPFRVCHSIPDSVGFAIDTPAGLIVHTSDFKLDETPIDGRLTDFAKLRRFAARGVHLLISDCVHIEAQGRTPSESVIGATYQDVFARAEGRIVVATFASLIARIQQIIDVAAKIGRRVATLGRSLEANVKVATRIGLSDRSGACPGRTERSRVVAGSSDRLHRHWQSGRADGGAQSDREWRPPRSLDWRGRHRNRFGNSDSGQRDRCLPDHQQAFSGRRRRNLSGHGRSSMFRVMPAATN